MPVYSDQDTWDMENLYNICVQSPPQAHYHTIGVGCNEDWLIDQEPNIHA